MKSLIYISYFDSSDFQVIWKKRKKKNWNWEKLHVQFGQLELICFSFHITLDNIAPIKQGNKRIYLKEKLYINL